MEKAREIKVKADEEFAIEKASLLPQLWLLVHPLAASTTHTNLS
jgi:hypothetical protein